MEKYLKNRFPLANLPTPIHHYPRLSRELGVEIFVKRDDLTESIASGNKIRKLEYLPARAKSRNADTLITCGGLQSNHCRAVAWVSARLGLKCILLLRGKPPETPNGNLLINKILGAEVHYFTKEEFNQVDDIGADFCERLKERNRRPFYIPLGGSNAVGALGYVRMVKEVADSGRHMDHICVALGSGGTLAGITAAVSHYRLPAAIHAISVDGNVADYLPELDRIGSEFREQYGLTVDFSGIEKTMDDQYVGEGYAINTAGELDELVRIARISGLVLDPVYTLKAFLGMMGHIKNGRIKPGTNVLFVHTGGHGGLFAKADEFSF